MLWSVGIMNKVLDSKPNPPPFFHNKKKTHFLFFEKGRILETAKKHHNKLIVKFKKK